MRKRSERLTTLLLLALPFTAGPAAATPLFAGTGAPGSNTQNLQLVAPSPATTNTINVEYVQPPSAADIKTLLAVTGITAQFPDIYEMLVQSRDSHSDRCTVSTDSVRNADRYHPQELQATLVQLLKSQMSTPALRDLLSWYESDLGMRIRSSEKTARDETTYDTYLDKARQLPNRESREASIRKVEKHTHANRLGVVTGVEIEYGGLILSGCIESWTARHQQSTIEYSVDNSHSRNSQQHKSQQRNRERERAKMTRADQPFFELLFYQDTLDSMAFALQDVSDDDLADYAEFVSGKDASHVFSTLVDALKQTLRAASETSIRSTDKHAHQKSTGGRLHGNKDTADLMQSEQTPEIPVADPVTTLLDH